MGNADRLDNYFRITRNEPLRLLPSNTRRLLSLGCASGATEAMLKEHLDIEEVVGIELEKSAASQAAERLDTVHIGDIELLDLPYAPGYFDALLCLDILEHLRDPWGVLRDKLNPLLAPGATVIVSLPNARYWVLIWRLLWGQWPYARRGILDIGHLRFFTPRTGKQMLIDAGFESVRVHRKYRLYDSLKDRPAGRIVGGITRRLTNGLNRLRFFDILYPARDFFTFQMIIVAQKATQEPIL